MATLEERNGETIPAKTNQDHTPRSLYPEHYSGNIVDRVGFRQMLGGAGVPHYGSDKYIERSLYQNLTPNFSVTNVRLPEAYLRTFTPDGNLLISFDTTVSKVKIYKFLGPDAANHLFESVRNPNYNWYQNQGIRSDDYSDGALEIRTKIFNCLFKLKAEVEVAPGKLINREIGVVTADSRYFIAGSVGKYFTASDSSDSDSDSEDMDADEAHEDSIFPTPCEVVHDYCFSVVDLKYGNVVATKEFYNDEILLTHNQGIYLYDRTLAIFSLKRQTIHIFNLTSDGKLQEVRTIGRFSNVKEEELFNAVPEFHLLSPKKEAFRSSLGQQIVSFLYHHFDEGRVSHPKAKSFSEYCEILDYYSIGKMQLLDESTLLLKYSSPDCISGLKEKPGYHFFVFYDMENSKVIEVFDIFTEALSDTVLTFTARFKNTHLVGGGNFYTDVSNSAYCQRKLEQSRKRYPNYDVLVLTHYLTMYCQCYTTTPYQDHDLFCWDPTKVSFMEKPRPFSGGDIHWYSRHFVAPNFTLKLTELPKDPGFPRVGFKKEDNLLKQIFHPSAPFLISLQRIRGNYYVNLHFRLDTGAFFLY